MVKGHSAEPIRVAGRKEHPWVILTPAVPTCSDVPEGGHPSTSLLTMNEEHDVDISSQDTG